MKSILLPVIAASFAFMNVSCKNMQYNGTTFNTEYDTAYFVARDFVFDESFDKMDMNGYNIVTYSIGDAYRVAVRSSEKAFAKATITVKDGTLVVERNETVRIDPLIFDVTIPSLNYVEMEGTGSFSAKMLKGDILSVKVMGGTSVNVDSVVCNEIEIESDGAGMIDMKVNAKNQVDVETNGASKVIMDIVSAGKVAIETNGAGSVNANVKSDIMVLQGNGANNSNINVDVRELTVGANGVAKIDVSGIADTANIDVNGLAKCDRNKLKMRGAE